MGKFIDLTGDRYGRLTVLRRMPNLIRSKSRQVATFLCTCECGEEVIVRSDHLRTGNTRSCGCLQREAAQLGLSNRSHGESRRSLEYASWAAMKSRCTNPNEIHYERYGGRGISVCDRWQSYEGFLADMGRRPSPQHSLDRINNDANYDKSNCRWATKKEQANNRRKPKLKMVKSHALT